MPREQRAVGRPRRDPTRSRRARRAPATPSRRAARPRCRTRRRARSRTRPRRAPRPPARPRGRRGSAPARRRRRRAITTSRPSPATTTSSSSSAQHQPPPSPHVGGHDDRRRRAVGRRRPRGRRGRRSCRSRRAGSPPGDQRGSATPRDRATIAAVIRAVTPANASRAGSPAARDPPGSWALACIRASPPSILVTSCLIVRSPCRAPATPCASPSSSTAATRTAAGQGVYSRHLTRELTELGHTRDDARRASRGRSPTTPVTLEQVAGLDLYRRENPFRVPWPYEFRTVDDLAGVRDHVHGRVPRAVRVQPPRLQARCATGATSSTSCTTTSASARGLLGFVRDGWPFVNTLHHPITVDRDLDLAAASGPLRRLTLRRWYGFLGMQMQRRAPGAAPHHGVGELEEGHRRPDGRRPRHAAHRAGRRRPEAVPPDAAHRSACPAG